MFALLSPYVRPPFALYPNASPSDIAAHAYRVPTPNFPQKCITQRILNKKIANKIVLLQDVLLMSQKWLLAILHLSLY
jgi:hypothetical protein